MEPVDGSVAVFRDPLAGLIPWMRVGDVWVLADLRLPWPAVRRLYGYADPVAVVTP